MIYPFFGRCWIAWSNVGNDMANSFPEVSRIDTYQESEVQETPASVIAFAFDNGIMEY